MNTRNSRNRSSGGHSSENLEEVYQLGYDHGYNDASRGEDYDDDFSEYEVYFEDDDDYDNDDDDRRGGRSERGSGGGSQQRNIQGRFTSGKSSSGSRSGRRSGSSSGDGTSRRGFASMSKAERIRIARMGGQASHGGGRSSGRSGFGGRRNS